MGIIDGGASFGDLDMSSAFERSEHHEQVCRSIPFIFIIMTLRLSLLHRQWVTDLLEQLLGTLIETDKRPFGVAGPTIDGQYILHRCYERCVRFGRNDPLLFAVGLENVFLERDQLCCRWRHRRSP